MVWYVVRSFFFFGLKWARDERSQLFNYGVRGTRAPANRPFQMGGGQSSGPPARIYVFQRNAGIGENLGELFELYPEWQGRPEMAPVAVPMKAGAASFHSGMTAHGAGANMTPRRRRAMTCGYMPDGD